MREHAPHGIIGALRQITPAVIDVTRPTRYLWKANLDNKHVRFCAVEESTNDERRRSTGRRWKRMAREREREGEGKVVHGDASES